MTLEVAVALLIGTALVSTVALGTAAFSAAEYIVKELRKA